MKKMTFIAAAALMASSAFAGDHAINLQGRMSWINTNRDTTKTHLPNDSRIAAERADLTFAGKLSSNTKYTLGLNLASMGLGTSGADASPTKNSGDNTSGFIDSIYVTKTLAEGLTLDIGKRPLLGGGFEVTHLAIDEYAKSNYWTTVDSTGNQFGLTLSKEMMGHSLMLQLNNGNKDRTVPVTTGTSASQSKMGWAAEWMGDYAHGMLKTNVGYTVIPSATATQSTNLLGAGLQLNVSKFVVEADYDLITGKKALNNGGTDSKKSSIVGVVSYTGMETVTPFAKFMVDTYKDAAVAAHYGEKTSGVTSFGLGVEFKEAKADAIRYHAVYTSSKYKYETVGGTLQGTDHTDSTILIGAKMDVNIL
jgi:hypothetical protein